MLIATLWQEMIKQHADKEITSRTRNSVGNSTYVIAAKPEIELLSAGIVVLLIRK